MHEHDDRRARVHRVVLGPIFFLLPYGPAIAVVAAGLLALGVLDGTFVAAVSFSAPEAELLRYFDALEPVPAAGIDFKR